MTARLFVGQVHHTRYLPQQHSFTYPIFYLALDLMQPQAWPAMRRVFGFNRVALTSIRERDYLRKNSGSLLQQIELVYKEAGLSVPHQVYLVTMPRLFGYVFNPVSFYIAWHADGSLHSMLAEVNNTFGEKHLYFMPQRERVGLPVRFDVPKQFYVSPFFPAHGQYAFALKQFGAEFKLSIELFEGSARQLWAEIDCKGMPLSRATLLLTLLRLPGAVLMVMMRIQYQALVLYFRRGVAVFDRPAPFSPGTVRSHVALVHRLRLRVLSCFRRRAGRIDTSVV